MAVTFVVLAKSLEPSHVDARHREIHVIVFTLSGSFEQYCLSFHYVDIDRVNRHFNWVSISVNIYSLCVLGPLLYFSALNRLIYIHIFEHK